MSKSIGGDGGGEINERSVSVRVDTQCAKRRRRSLKAENSLRMLFDGIGSLLLLWRCRLLVSLLASALNECVFVRERAANALSRCLRAVFGCAPIRSFVRWFASSPVRQRPAFCNASRYGALRRAMASEFCVRSTATAATCSGCGGKIAQQLQLQLASESVSALSPRCPAKRTAPDAIKHNTDTVTAARVASSDPRLSLSL